MRNTLIAVGGSGESAVIAYLRMAILSGMPAKELPNILVFDADIADKQDNNEVRPSLYKLIETLFEELTKGVQKDAKPILKQMLPYYANTPISERTTFLDYIGGGGTANTELLNCLFSQEEQSLLLRDGFMATPNVAAITFFDKTQRLKETRNTDRELTALQDTIAAGANHPVIVVIGSSYGGTGSGVAPSLAQKLAEIVQNNQQINTVRLGLFMILPWFSPSQLPNDPNAEETHGNLPTQKANAAGGLRYYASSQLLQNSVDLFIADYDGRTDYREDQSNSKQGEFPRAFNLLLAAQIQNYFLFPLPKPDNQQNNQQSSQTYTCYDFKSNAAQNIDFNGGDSSIFGFSSFDKYRQDIEDWASETQSVRLAFKYFAIFLKNDFKPKDGDRRNKEDFPILVKLVGKIAEKDAQLKDKVIFKVIADELNNREQELQRSIDWLRELAGASEAFSLRSESITNGFDDYSYRKYPALHQEIIIETGFFKKIPTKTFLDTSERAAIHLFETATKNCAANEIIAVFNQRLTTGQSLGKAAVAELENCLRKTIRQLSPAQKRLQDNRVADNREGYLERPLIPMQINGQPRKEPYNRILFSLTDLIDDGFNRDGHHVTKLDDHHPASISILKPSNIPSPWGAALLEDWRQAAAYDNRRKKQADLPAQFRLEQVINRVEAILWGIFSKRLTVKQVDDDSILTEAVASVRHMELKLDKNHPVEPRIFVAEHAETQQLIAANYPTVGWFNVPDISENWWQSEANFELPSSIITTEKDPTAYALRQAEAFISWINTIRNLQQSNSPIKPTWFNMLSELLKRFDGRLAKIEPADIVVKPSDCFIVGVIDTSSQYILQTVPYYTLGRSFDDIVTDYCVDEVLALQNSDGKFQITDNPLKSEYFADIKIISKPEIISNTDDKHLKVRYQLKLPNMGLVNVIRKAKIMEYFGSRTSIYPKFKANTWQFYYIGSNDSPITRNDVFTFKIWGCKKANGELGWLLDEQLTFGRNYELQGIPEYLVLFEKNGTEMSEKGAINIDLVESEAAGGVPFRLALDFGTSHSCVYATTNNNDPIGGFDLSKPNTNDRSLLKDIIVHQAAEDIYEQFYFLGCLAAKSATHDHNVIPSELKLHGNEEHRKRAHLNIAKGIHHLAMLPMNFANNAAEKDVKKNATLGGFKWGMKGVVIPAFQDKTSIVDLTKLFNKDLLRHALAILRWQGYDKLVTFRATYPESFNDTQITTYAGALTRVLEDVQSETGFSFADTDKTFQLKDLKEHKQATSDSHGLISESIAALKTVAMEDKAQQLHLYGITFVLDMGGGSTDIAVYISQPYFDNRGLSNITLPRKLTDSIVYAGHDVLEMLATQEIVKISDEASFNELEQDLIDGNFSEEEKHRKRAEGWLRILKIAMRNTENVEKLQLALAHDPEFEAKTLTKVALFYQGMFEYVRQLIFAYDAALKQQNVNDWHLNILLLGNGWRLADFAFPLKGDGGARGAINGMTEYLSSINTTISRSISFPDNSSCSVKQAIAKGALMYDPLKDNFMANHELCGFAGLNMTQGQQTITHDSLIAPFAKDSEIIQIKDLDSLPIEFNSMLEKIDEAKGEINSKINSEFKAYNQKVRGTDKSFIISPMRYFLELVWKNAVKKYDQ